MSLTYYTMCQQKSQVKDMNVARYSRKNKKAVADSPRQFSYFILGYYFSSSSSSTASFSAPIIP